MYLELSNIHWMIAKIGGLQDLVLTDTPGVGLQVTNLINPTMQLPHIPQGTIQNRNVYISALNGALWVMGQVHCGICEFGLLDSLHCMEWLQNSHYAPPWVFIICDCVLNPLRAKFFRGNINIYLHFISLLHIDMTQVLKMLPQVRPGLTYPT